MKRVIFKDEKMMMKTVIKVVLLISLGWFLASRLLSGTLNFYIHPRFNGLTMITAVMLIIIAAAYWLQKRSTHDDEVEHDHDHHHDHDISWIGLALLAVPVVLGLLVEPKPLGANALGNREVNVNPLAAVPAAGSAQFSTIATGGKMNIVDWLYSFQRSADPAQFNGEEANVIGFVYRDDRFAPDMFMVSRFTISCCVADAAPVGLVVEWPEAANLPDDTWVEVNGRFTARAFNGVTMPVLIADAIAQTEAPSQPYLYQ